MLYVILGIIFLLLLIFLALKSSNKDDLQTVSTDIGNSQSGPQVFEWLRSLLTDTSPAVVVVITFIIIFCFFGILVAISKR